MVWQTPSQRVVIFIMLILWVCAVEPPRPTLADEPGPAKKYPCDVGTSVGVTLQYTYADSVLTSAYGSVPFRRVMYNYRGPSGENRARATLVTRQFLYLRPDVFVIFDRAHATDASFTKDWILHMWNNPQVNGKRLAADLNAHDGGWAEYDGDTVSFVGCQKLGVEAGKMFVKVLLPEKRIIRKRGGKIKIANSTGTKCVLDSNLGNDVQHKINRSLGLSPGGG